MNKYQIGFDLQILVRDGIKIPIMLSPLGHLLIIGGSGSGKSTSLLYFIYKMGKCNNIELTIADFKASHEFAGITSHFAEYEDCYELIKSFYENFQNTPEGGSGFIKILIIDEVAGLLSHFTMIDKKKADEIRLIMSSLLMLGRSRQCFLWLSMQRYSATIFPSGSGGGDNFHFKIGLGALTVDGRKAVFAGEHFDGEDSIIYTQGRGIVSIDGESLKALVVPRVSKSKLLSLLQDRAEGGRSTP